MKRQIIFFSDKNSDIGAGKAILFLVNLVCSFLSFIGGRFMPLGFIFFLPIFVFSAIVTVFYIQKSRKNHTFEIFTLFYLPILFCGITGYALDRIDTNHTRKTILEAQSYVQNYYEEHNELPDKGDSFLSEKGVTIEGEEGHFTLYYKDARIRDSENRVYFRPRP